MTTETSKKKVIAVESAARPVIKEGDRLPEGLEVQSTAVRPMIWLDLPRFAQRHNRTALEMMFDLGFNTTFQYQSNIKKREVIPFDLELLVQVYEKYPGPCGWVKPNVRDVFQMLYAVDIKKFPEEYEAKAYMSLGTRYADLLGRTKTVLYRWMTDSGQTSRRVINIISKIEELAQQTSWEHARAEFERISIERWLIRGYDLERAHPVPTLATISKNLVRRSQVSDGVANRIVIGKLAYQGGTFG